MNMKDIHALLKSGRIVGFKAHAGRQSKVAAFRTSNTETGPKIALKFALEEFCKEQGLPLFAEQRFHVERKWRFDFLIPSRPVAIEYEGIFSRDARRNGHQNQTHYTKDTDKYRAAAMQGIMVLRYTAKNYQQCIPDLKKILSC